MTEADEEQRIEAAKEEVCYNYWEFCIFEIYDFKQITVKESLRCR